jgi:CHAT domain-containing protein
MKTVQLQDPMLRSGLALAGANTTAKLWEVGKVPPLDQDGLLTAAEVAGLDLQGTRLVTMSACDTAKGDLLSGEGVVGLQRAMAIAGAENLLMTLWPINDADTPDFMAEFYKRVIAGEHPARALPEVQRHYLAKWRAKHNLWYAINRAAPFVIVSLTNVPPTRK